MRDNVDRDAIIRRLGLLICAKADGVFLWVYYVLRNVCIGLQDYDTLQDLLKQIDMLPSGITDLYHHMWKTQNSDNILHASETAKLFRLARYVPLSLHQLTVAMYDDLQHHYLSEFQPVDDEELGNRCRAFSRRLGMLSAGLLECGDFDTYGGGPYNLVGGCVDLDDQDKPWVIKKEEFFHRSVYEYLFETEKGKAITQFDASRSKDDTAMSMGTAYVASLIEGYNIFALSQIEILLEYLQMDDTELQVLDKLGEFCGHVLQEYLFPLKDESHNWVHGMYICDWHVDTLEPRHLDSAGLRVSVLSSFDSVLQFLAGPGQDWSGYYKGYLAITMLQSKKWDPVRILSECVDQGADMTTPHALPSVTPIFYLRSPALVALANQYVSLLRSLGWREDIQKVVELASFLTKYPRMLEGQEFTVVAHSSIDCFGCDDMGLDSLLCNMQLLVIFKAQDALEVISDIAQEYVRSVETSQRRSNYSHQPRGHNLDALRKKAWDDYRTRVKHLPKKMIYVKQEGVAGSYRGFKFAVPSEKHAEHLKNSLFHTGPELFSAEGFHGPPGGIDDAAWVDQLPCTAPTSLVQDLYHMDREIGMPSIPLDPYKEVESGDWKSVCTMRHYFQQVKNERKGVDSSSK